MSRKKPAPLRTWNSYWNKPPPPPKRSPIDRAQDPPQTGGRTLRRSVWDASRREAGRARQRAAARWSADLGRLSEVPTGETPVVGEDAGRPTWWRIAYHCRPYRLHILAVLLLDLVAIPLFLLHPVALKIGVDSVVHSKPLPAFLDPLVPDSVTGSDLWILAVVVCLQVGVALMTQLQEVTRYVLGTYTGERITLNVRAKLFAHMQRMSMLFHDARGTTDSIYRVQYDAPSLQYVTVDGVVPLVTATIMLVSMLVVIAMIDWQLAIIALVVAPFLFWLSRSFGNKMRPRYHELKGVETNAMEVVQEVLTALRVVKAFGRERSEQERFLHTSVEGLRARVRLAMQEGAFGLWVNLTTAVGTAAVFFVGIRNVTGGVLTLGEFLMVAAYLVQLYSPLKTINATFAAVQQSLAGADRVFEILDRVPDVTEKEDAEPLQRAKGHIELRRVSFSYEGNAPVLGDVSLAVEPGTRVGIVGPTGAGKSTLIGLVSRTYDATEGQVLIDGVDVKDYKLADLRAQFAIVLQEPVLFSTSIAENIAFGKADATEDEIIEAARAANIHDFILGLPDGYATRVGERGMRMSGGERQRISLARAFVKDAPILVLDEPTSSIDRRTEAEIIDAIARLMQGRTTLMIAHHLDTLRDCDMLIAVENGGITLDPDSPFPARSAQLNVNVADPSHFAERHLSSARR